MMKGRAVRRSTLVIAIAVVFVSVAVVLVFALGAVALADQPAMVIGSAESYSTFVEAASQVLLLGRCPGAVPLVWCV